MHPTLIKPIVSELIMQLYRLVLSKSRPVSGSGGSGLPYVQSRLTVCTITTKQNHWNWPKYWCARLTEAVFRTTSVQLASVLQTFLDYPPMQRGASFNLDTVKTEMAKKMAQAPASNRSRNARAASR